MHCSALYFVAHAAAFWGILRLLPFYVRLLFANVDEYVQSSKTQKNLSVVCNWLWSEHTK